MKEKKGWWRRLPYWLKGGVISLFIGIIMFTLSTNCALKCGENIECLGCLLYLGPFSYFVFKIQNTILAFLTILLSFFVIGTIIYGGLIELHKKFKKR